ncbi:MAG: hypothetical protein AAGD38_05870 [Acidobacteriota bacterium]
MSIEPILFEIKNELFYTNMVKPRGIIKFTNNTDSTIRISFNDTASPFTDTNDFDIPPNTTDPIFKEIQEDALGEYRCIATQTEAHDATPPLTTELVIFVGSPGLEKVGFQFEPDQSEFYVETQAFVREECDFVVCSIENRDNGEQRFDLLNLSVIDGSVELGVGEAICFRIQVPAEPGRSILSANTFGKMQTGGTTHIEIIVDPDIPPTDS